MSELERLTETFRRLGANDPESWALSQINDGINQLGRFLFLKRAWSLVIDDDAGWIDKEIAESGRNPRAPFAGIGLALTRLKAAGVDEKLLTDTVRGMQASTLFYLCSLLDDSGDFPEIPDNVNWRLFQVDEEGNPVSQISAIHESVLEMDPTGREMRPKEE